jgi:hypothetical protein
MKHLFIIFITMFLLVSCGNFCEENRTYEVNYSICYPDTVITKTDTLTGNSPLYIWERREVIFTSYRGTNYLLVGNNEYIKTTCPIRLNYYKRIQ